MATPPFQPSDGLAWLTYILVMSTLPAAICGNASITPAADESLRLNALHDYQILDTPDEAAFNDITRLAALICEAPIAVVNLIDRERQWFKSEIGLGVKETALDVSICAHAILQDELFVVPDTLRDARFANNPLVTGEPHLRFYAGALLKTPDGLPLGTVCVLDHQPRQLTAAQAQALQALARQTMTQLELRRMLRQAQQSSRFRSRLMAIAGHDLRTPLRTAGYAIEKVRRTASDTDAALLRLAQESLSEVSREFDELATVAGTENEYAAPDLVSLPIGELLQSVVRRWQPQARARGLELRVARCSLNVRSHRALLTTLVGNLVGNAVKYTECGGVLVGVRRRGDSAVIEVIDTGAGLPQGSGVFGAFHQADPQRDGLGLGLWIVRRTAEALGYTVQVQSREGRGTRFSITVPVA